MDMSNRALFEGLVFDPNGNPTEVSYVGNEAQYVVTDGGFKFHVPSENVDLQVLGQMREQILANREAVTSSALQMLGKDDLFSKAMVDASLNNMDGHFKDLIAQGLPAEARTYLGMLGFRVVINYHGEVLDFNPPGATMGEDE